MWCQQLIRQRAELLQSRDHHIIDFLVVPLLRELVVHLTSTKNMSSDLLRSNEGVGVGVGYVPLEYRIVGHLVEA